MLKWDTFIASISFDECEEIIRDYEYLCEHGYVDECLLRRKAREWISSIGSDLFPVVLSDIANAAYREQYKYFKELVMNPPKY